MPLAPAPARVGALCAVALCSLALPTGAFAKKSATPKLPAKFQKRYHVKSALADPDHDGLTNYTEYRAHTNPKKADTDRDGIPDGSEDFDKDKLDNLTEQRAGTDPGKKDTNHNGRSDALEDADHDGLNNLAEQNTANDPGDPDSDDDGIKDGNENAGQIVSFSGAGVLRLRLASTGKVISAPVDESTSVDCATTDGYDGGADDDAADDVSDDSGDDDASAARVQRADDGDDDFVPADDSDLTDDDASDDDGCADQLAAGAWVHESSLGKDDTGATVFDAVALVGDDE
ncbi:MAG TPA: hypothetical protein VFG42_08125 [Baekduia sp.]|uniref:hypothetical protein n=1 Tax=Baekduia sp. TaxID=2600305 RepID=UPI002D79F3D5|nr:hypothetical protein [Baekduia sp.]HET6506742.1 hypothetical protein [Baekduia sp.]